MNNLSFDGFHCNFGARWSQVDYLFQNDGYKLEDIVDINWQL